MATSEGTTKKCLDDSLTNIQWLCELESSELLLAKKTARVDDPILVETVAPHSPNPYSRPPYSYATLILLAINSTEEKRMTLQEIYKWIQEHYPYYSKCKKAWKNSIRHNLSLHSFFLKEKRPIDLPGKGSYWSISPEGKENIMREVIKHAQPVIQGPFGQGLRPILPKPTQMNATDNASDRAMPKISGVCSLVNGGGVMPVVVLPTNVYMSLATKIASGNVKGNIAALGMSTNSTGMTPVPQCNFPAQQALQQHADGAENGSNNMNALMNEILQDANFSEVLDSLEEENVSTTESVNVVSDHDTVNQDPSNKENKNIPTRTPTRKHKNSDISAGPVEPKHSRKAETDEYFFRKPTPIKKSTPVHRPSRSPLRERNQPTLAAINNDYFMHADKDFKFQDLSQLMLSPVCAPSKRNSTTSANTSSPNCSSPLACSTFRSGLTPLKYDSDSGFFTPLKDSDFAYLLSPNQLEFGLTPAKNAGATPQKCRKSLRLGTLMEEENENDAMPWMQI